MAGFEPLNRPIDVKHYQVSLEIDPSSDPSEFEATARLKIYPKQTVEEFSLDIDSLDIRSVDLVVPKKRPVSFEVENSKVLRLMLPQKFKKDQLVTVDIRYRGKIGSAHQGLFKVTDPDEPNRGPLLFTHFEPLKARAFLPCNDEPYDKATTELRVTVPAKYDTVANGKRVKDRKFKKDGKNLREVHWVQNRPHPTYLISLAIAPFAKLSKHYQGKEVSVWVGETKKKQAEYPLEITRKLVKYFEDYLGVKYPWSKYATVGLPTFLWGGMENTSSTHMNQERTVLIDPNSSYDRKNIAGLAAHELAHQWFGDYVTMRWWDDLWLNEAFASLLGTLGTRHVMGGTVEADLDVVLDTWDSYFREENGPRSHPIIDKGLSTPDDAFDAINYTKGENVLRMLQFYVGEEKFRKGLKLYLQKHALDNATYIDFFAAQEKASGEKLSVFRDSWLLQRGYPIVSFSGEQKGSVYSLTLEQRPNHSEDSSTFVFRIPVVFHRRSNPEYHIEKSCHMDKKTCTVEQKLPAPPEWVTVNPGAGALAKVAQLSRNEEILKLQALYDTDPIARVWAHYELLSPFLEGSQLSSVAESIAIEGLKTDRSPYVRVALLTAFSKMKNRWLPPQLAGAVLEMAREAVSERFLASQAFQEDAHGWRQWRSKLLGTVGRVDQKESLVFLKEVVQRKDLPLDDLGEAAKAVANLGDDTSVEVLKSTVEIHRPRGYRYQFVAQFAFGALESPQAAQEIREIAKTCGSDYIGRVGRAVRDNQTLKNSAEWSKFLEEFILENERFGEEVKTRILQTIEEVKKPHVKGLLEQLVKKSDSTRIKESAKKILEKNFT